MSEKVIHHCLYVQIEAHLTFVIRYEQVWFAIGSDGYSSEQNNQSDR